jgi:DinB superfamily
VDAIGLLVQQVQTVNLRLHHSAGDLTGEELVARPLEGVNPTGFLIWHMARSQDWAVNTAIRNVPEVIKREPWAGGRLAVPGIGTGFELEEAARAAARFELPALLSYADAVNDDMLAWLRTAGEAMLDHIPDVAAHDATHPEYQTPGFRAEMDSGPEHDDAVGRKGGLPAWIFLTSVSITHLHRHLGELDLVKDLLRRGAAGGASRGGQPAERRSQP